MNVGRFALFASFLGAAVCMAAPEPVRAFPAQDVRALIQVGPSGGIESVRCNCVRHLHHRRYVRRDEPDYGVPVYPAPPVGVTFRKLFDAGYL